MEHNVPHLNCPVPHRRTATVARVSKKKMKQIKKKATCPKTLVALSEHKGILAALLLAASAVRAGTEVRVLARVAIAMAS